MSTTVFSIQYSHLSTVYTRVVDLLSNGGIVALLHQRARGQRQHGGAGRSRACGAVCTGAAAVDGASFSHAMHLSNLLPSPSPPRSPPHRFCGAFCRESTTQLPALLKLGAL